MRGPASGREAAGRSGMGRIGWIAFAILLSISGPPRPCRADGHPVRPGISMSRKLVLSARIADARRDERRVRHRKSLIRMGKARLLVPFVRPEGNDQFRVPPGNDAHRFHPIDP